MTILNGDSKILNKRRTDAINAQTVAGSKSRLYYTCILLVSFVCIVSLVIFSMMWSADAQEEFTEQEVKTAINQAKEDGVKIQNFTYSNPKKQMFLQSDFARQSQNFVALNTVKGQVDNVKMEADKAVVYPQKGTATVSGNVKLEKKEKKKKITITSDEVIFDDNKKRITGTGGVKAKNDTMKIQGGSFVYETDKKVLTIKKNVIIELEE